jgi:hypothetical protein
LVSWILLSRRASKSSTVLFGAERETTEPVMFILVGTKDVFYFQTISDTFQTKIADLVQIHPEDFNKEASQAIEDNINAKYANKVIQKIGLCICLYDLLSASEGLIGHGTGLVNVNGMFGGNYGSKPWDSLYHELMADKTSLQSSSDS